MEIINYLLLISLSLLFAGYEITNTCRKIIRVSLRKEKLLLYTKIPLVGILVLIFLSLIDSVKSLYTIF
ncbi:MAG: hypothetical protein AB1567_09830 [bacterium]